MRPILALPLLWTMMAASAVAATPAGPPRASAADELNRRELAALRATPVAAPAPFMGAPLLLQSVRDIRVLN